MNSEKLLNIINQTKNFNVLYVEDNPKVQEQTTKILKSFFKKIDLAQNGQEGIDFFTKSEQEYNLIITDIKMPLVDGITFIEHIRKTNKQVPIVVLSAHDDKEYFLKTINIGVDGYILKPYTLEQISNTLENIIKKYDFTKKENDEITYLEFDFIWLNKQNQLMKNDEIIKLTRNETKLFELFITTNSTKKTYEEIENYLFDFYEDNTKKMRNLIARLKVKLDCELFEAIYSYGYMLKYKKDN